MTRMKGMMVCVLVWLVGNLAAAQEAKLELVIQTGHANSVWSVALSGDDRLLLTGSGDKTAILWDAQTGNKLRTFAGHTSAVYSVALSGDGRRALTGSDDHTAILWDAQTGNKLPYAPT